MGLVGLSVFGLLFSSVFKMVNMPFLWLEKLKLHFPTKEEY